MLHTKGYKAPINMEKMPQEDIDEQILRSVMIAELATVQEYEQMCYNTSNQEIKDMLEELIEDEEEHFNKAQELLKSVEEENEDEDD